MKQSYAPAIVWVYDRYLKEVIDILKDGGGSGKTSRLLETS
jgi:hypothetical protein